MIHFIHTNICHQYVGQAPHSLNHGATCAIHADKIWHGTQQCGAPVNLFGTAVKPCQPCSVLFMATRPAVTFFAVVAFGRPCPLAGSSSS